MTDQSTLDLVPGALPDRQRIALVAFGQAVGASPAFQNAPLAEAPGDIRPVIGRAGSLQAFPVQPFSGGGVALGAADIAQHDQHGARVAPPDLAVERHALFDVFLGALDVGIDDGLTARLARGALLLRRKFEIDAHRIDIYRLS